MGLDVTRRTVLTAFAALPVVVVGARVLGRSRRAAAALRPGPDGASTNRCALCGSRSHAMLGCPDAPKVV